VCIVFLTTVCPMSTVPFNSLFLFGHSLYSTSCPRPALHFCNLSCSELFMNWHACDYDVLSTESSLIAAASADFLSYLIPYLHYTSQTRVF
jgi:hypothetical protein